MMWPGKSKGLVETNKNLNIYSFTILCSYILNPAFLSPPPGFEVVGEQDGEGDGGEDI